MVSRNRVTRASWPEAISAVTVAVTVATFVAWVVVVETSHSQKAAAHAPPPVTPIVSPTPPRSPTTHAPLSAKVAAPPHGDLYWGAFVPRARRLGAVASFERTVGRHPSVVMWFEDRADRPAFPVRTARRLERHGIVPMLTWEPWVNGRPSSAITLRGIARGRYDAYFRRFAGAVRRYGGPLFFRPMHEMDGDWYPWSGYWPGNSPAMFVRAWRHMHRVFVRAGATNATWVWSVNQYSVPHVSGNSIERYWPGARFVDWVAVSAFNAGPVRSPYFWQSFDAVFGPRYVDLLHYRKPIMVAETGAPEQGGDKASWISDMFRSLRLHYSSVGALLWYDQRDAIRPSVGDWRVDSSRRALAAFRRAVRGDRVLSAPIAVERTRRRL